MPPGEAPAVDALLLCRRGCRLPMLANGAHTFSPGGWSSPFSSWGQSLWAPKRCSSFPDWCLNTIQKHTHPLPFCRLLCLGLQKEPSVKKHDCLPRAQRKRCTQQAAVPPGLRRGHQSKCVAFKGLQKKPLVKVPG
eukprot:1157834-Pelagomonas_calceolata.AAC.10